MVGKLSNDEESSSKEPEKSDDAPSTSKVPEKADDNPSTSTDSDSSSVSSLVEVTTPRTPSPVPKPRRLIPSPARLPESSSDSSVEEIPIPRTLSPVPKPSRSVVPSSSHIPTLETASPVAKPREQYGALSFLRCDHDWYDNLCELQYTDAQQMTDGKDDQSGKLSLIIVPMSYV